jgi:hypothetical protein
MDPDLTCSDAWVRIPGEKGYMTQGRMGGGTGFLSSREQCSPAALKGKRYAQRRGSAQKVARGKTHW